MTKPEAMSDNEWRERQRQLVHRWQMRNGYYPERSERLLRIGLGLGVCLAFGAFIWFILSMAFRH